MEKYFLMILNCQKYKIKREIQRRSWLQECPINWFHVIGDETLSSVYRYVETEKILYVQCKDTYECLPIKTYLSIYAILDLFPHVQYILKTDDDMKCNILNFKSALITLENYDYGGEFVDTKGYISTYHYPNVQSELRIPFQIKSTKYCPGRFYFLSRKVCEQIKNNKDYFYKQIFEDYAIGYFVTRIQDIQCLHIDAKSIFYDNN